MATGGQHPVPPAGAGRDEAAALLPGFVDARDAILAADLADSGGANKCLIWDAFARRGLGFSASQGSSASRTDGTEAFDLPSACSGVDLDRHRHPESGARRVSS